MTIIIIVFVSALAVALPVLLLFTRPTAQNRTISARVASIHVNPADDMYLGDGLPEFLKHTKLSKIRWLDALLQRWTLAHDLRLLLQQAESSWSVPMVFAAAVGSAAVGFLSLYVWLPDIGVCVVIGILFASLPFFLLQMKRSRRTKRFTRALPDAVELLARALRAGHSISAAIEIVGTEAAEPVRSEFREVYRQQNFGLPQREALLQLARRMPAPDLRFVVTAMLVQKETGGNLVDILDRAVAVVRDRIRIEGQVRVHTAQGRMTGIILSLLPIVMFILINLVDHGYTKVLVDDPLGRQLVYIGLVSMVIGGLIIRKIVNVKV